MASARKTPMYKHAPIEMEFRVSEDTITKAGEFTWRFRKNGGDPLRILVVAIPTSAEGHWCLSSWPIEHENANNAEWRWDGEELKPTLEPSLHAVGVWHGRVTAGQLIEG